MKILLVTYEFPPFHGGVAAYLSTLVSAAPSTAQVTVDVPPKGEHWLKTFLRVSRLNRTSDFDLLLVSHVLPAGYVARLLKTFGGVPYVVLTHGTDILSGRRSGWKRFWMRSALRGAKLVVSNSRYTASLLREEGICNVNIVPPSLNPADYAFEANRAKSGHVILSVGRVIERKGFDTVIRALPDILKAYPDAKYLIVGEGPDQERLLRLATELGVADALEFKGNLDDQARNRLFADATVFAAPVRRVGNDIEGFGIVIIEAAAHGLPVIVGRSGGAPETVRDNQTGFVIAPEDADAISENVIKLFADPQLAAKFGVAGRAFVSREYSTATVAKTFWELLHA